MPNQKDFDKQDQDESRKIIIAVLALLIILGAGVVLLLPSFLQIIAIYFAPGLGLKAAAIVAFFVTIIMMVVLTVAAGDGFIGEIQFILGAFLMFFVIIWLMLAWIF